MLGGLLCRTASVGDGGVWICAVAPVRYRCARCGQRAALPGVYARVDSAWSVRHPGWLSDGGQKGHRQDRGHVPGRVLTSMSRTR